MKSCDHQDCVVVWERGSCPLCQSETLVESLNEQLAERHEEVVAFEERIEGLKERIDQMIALSPQTFTVLTLQEE